MSEKKRRCYLILCKRYPTCKWAMRGCCCADWDDVAKDPVTVKETECGEALDYPLYVPTDD